MPRQAILNDVRRGELFALLSSGLNLADAARYLGCTVRTIQNAAKRDAEFRRQLDNAALSARLDPLKLMRQAAGSHWRAAAWLLERTDPDRFAARAAGTCRPEQVEDAFARLIEAALEELPDAAARRGAFKRLAALAEASTRELFSAAAARPERPRHATADIDQQLQRARDYFDATDGENAADAGGGGPGFSRSAPAGPAAHRAFFPRTAASGVERITADLARALAQKIREKEAEATTRPEDAPSIVSQKIDAPIHE